MDFEGPRALGSRAVTLLERDMVERGFPRGDLEPKAAPCEEFVADGFAAGQSDAEYVRILVNDGRPKTPVLRDDELFFGVGVCWVGVPLGVTWWQVALVRGDPDLQESNWLGG